MLSQGAIGRIAKAAKLSRQTVYRIKDDPAGAEAVMATWSA
jgi:putative DNA-invertase from lambdoid prophage Rac